jgi:hypothetical protein
MTLVLIASLFLALFVAAAAVAEAVRARRVAAVLKTQRDADELAGLVGGPVVVQTKDKQSIRGLLERATASTIVLAHGEYLSAGGREIGGVVFIDRVNVSWCQHPREARPTLAEAA